MLSANINNNHVIRYPTRAHVLPREIEVACTTVQRLELRAIVQQRELRTQLRTTTKTMLESAGRQCVFDFPCTIHFNLQQVYCQSYNLQTLSAQICIFIFLVVVCMCACACVCVCVCVCVSYDDGDMWSLQLPSNGIACQAG
jgi:hypothetical protein